MPAGLDLRDKPGASLVAVLANTIDHQEEKETVRNAVSFLIGLVVTFLVGGLLLSGIAKVREAANRMSCSNNLHQFGITSQTHENTLGYFPRANEPNPNLAPEKRLSWLVVTIPFLEASNLYSRIETKNEWEAEENRFLALMVIKTYQCPGYPDWPPVSALIPSHYVGIAGLGADAAALPLEDPRAGFFGYERQLTLPHIQGHTSTLLLALETLQAGGAWTAGGTATVRGLEENGLPYVGPKGQFGGIHRGGMNAAFADGSVRFIRDSVDPKVLEALATIQGSKNATSFGDE